MIYFTSDFHFNHENLLLTERTRFKNNEEHNYHIMQQWDKQVQHGDEIYVLGDFGFLLPDEIKFFKSLKGKKYFVYGNHDKRSENYYKELGFDIVHRYPIYIQNRVVLSHEPIPVTKEILNVHGHLHLANLDSSNHLNVNIHMHNYKFVSMKEINNIISNMPKISHSFLQEWYADKYVFTVERPELVVDENNKIILEATLKTFKNFNKK